MTQYIGFGTFKNFITAIGRDRPINIEKITDPGRPTKIGIFFVREAIVLSQVNRSEVLYLYVTVRTYQSQDGSSPLFEDKYPQATPSAWALTLERLRELSIPYREGLLAMPKNIKLLTGSLEFIKFDQAAGLYFKRPAEVSQ